MRFITLLLVLFLVGCKSQKPFTQTTEIVDSTTTVTTITPRDTLIKVAGDQVSLNVSLAELLLSPVSKKSKSGRSEANVALENDTIYVDCQIEELEMTIALQEKTINTLRKRLENSSEEIPVPFVPLLTKIFAWIGKLVVLAVVVLLGIKLLKPKLL